MRRTVVLALLGALLLSATGHAQDPAPAARRVLILGFDGAAADRTEALMAQDRLPNLAALRERGGYSPLRTTNPAQSPVAWASLTTGRNPGETGIYDFLRRVWTPGGVGISIGLAERVDEPLLPMWQRVSLVAAAGLLGALLGALLSWFGLGSFWPSWRRGGWMQAAMTLPAAILALGAMTVLRWVPAEVPTAHNLRGGEPFWVTLDRAGRRCVALEAPLGFPADAMEHGACLSGLGVPDMMGTWGSFAVWTDDPDVPKETETAGTGYFVGLGTDAFELVLPGPRDPLPDADALSEARRLADQERRRREVSFEWGRPQRRSSETQEALLRGTVRLRARLVVRLDRGQGATVTLQDGTDIALVPDRWSDLLPVTFDVSPLAELGGRARLHGRVRLRLSFAGRSFRIFVTPTQFDAARPPPNVGIVSPVAFGRELVDAVGPFETAGWPELTSGVKDGLLDDEAFLAHIRLLLANRERRLLDRIGKNDWDCLFAMFSETDRVQHVLYRHVDPQHPLHDPEAAERFGGEIDHIYEEMDRVVGAAVAVAGPETVVLVVSDHGFAPFRRGVNLNNLFRRVGLQVPLSGAASGPHSVHDLDPTRGGFFEDVDWGRTKAYAMGLGNVYLNLAGREPGGIVTPAEAPDVLAKIEQVLAALHDDDAHGGAKVVRRSYRGADIYSGARTDSAPDLVVGFERGYRVSWQNCLGALDADVITDNLQPWSGDHCSVDPEICTGILFSSVPLKDGVDPGVMDVVPSLLDLLDVPATETDGESFLRDE